MKTALRLSPADHGTRLPIEELDEAEQREGYKYEIIHGRLYVSPQPRMTATMLTMWLIELLLEYSKERPDVFNGVAAPARVYTPGSDEIAAPEPDIACYQGLPSRRRRRAIDWRRYTPLLVIEVISPDDPGKDLVRNPPLYLSVPSIKEYWVIDPRLDPMRPSFVIHQRHRGAWRVVEVAAGGVYTTKLLPGFALQLDADAEEE